MYKPTCAVVGALVGGIIGFLLRPANALIGQLPFHMVINRGSELSGLEQFLVPLAQRSFNLLMAGIIIGAFVGLVVGYFIDQNAKRRQTGSAGDRSHQKGAFDINTLLTKYDTDAGLLALRVGIGIMYIYHGAPKIAGGPEKWEKLGMAMGALGIDFLPVFWGFMAASSEFFGAVCLILGLVFRPATFLMATTMAVAATMHLTKGDGLGVASHAIENCILFVALFIIGPGKYANDEALFRK